MSGDVVIKGWVLRDTPSGPSVVFRAHGQSDSLAPVILPKSQIAVVKGAAYDEVTMPQWLAAQRGLEF
jgi:hypothetical protein